MKNHAYIFCIVFVLVFIGKELHQYMCSEEDHEITPIPIGTSPRPTQVTGSLGAAHSLPGALSGTVAPMSLPSAEEIECIQRYRGL